MPDRQHLEALANANQALARHEGCNGAMRPVYHFTAPYGWLNDPNGLIEFGGEYHLFYQHNPYATHWAQMHWGHATSKDMLAWAHQPVALAPSEAYDSDMGGGCYSGSAIRHNDTLTLMYTGCVHRGGGEWQTQNLAHSTDGVHFAKDPHNPVIAQPPEGGSEHFRDPKVWRQGQTHYVVLGNSMDARGCVQLYRSQDMRLWEYCGVLHRALPGQGWMWECPDFFPLGQRWMLTVSAMGATGKRNLWFVGDFDIATGHFAPIRQGVLDEGDDFYAAQTFLDAHDRRILIGWADRQNQRGGLPPDAATAAYGFCGQMSLPRVVTLANDDTPRFAPLPEVAACRRRPLHGEVACVAGEPVLLARVHTLAFETLLVLELQHSTAGQTVLEWRHDENHRTTLTFDLAEGMLRLDRNQTDETVCGVVACAVGMPDRLALHIFFDRNSVEIFVQGGEKVLSANVFPSQAGLEMWLSATEGTGPRAVWDVWRIEVDAPAQTGQGVIPF